MKEFITIKVQLHEYKVHYSQVYRNEIGIWFWRDKVAEIDDKTVDKLEEMYHLIPTSKQMMESAMDRVQYKI